MDRIMVYDIETTTWCVVGLIYVLVHRGVNANALSRFNVTASGDIPSPRSEFCSAVLASPDDSSFQITMYGGWSLLDGRAFEDVYVLSIPSFRWIKVDDKATNKEVKLPGAVGRKGLTCHMRGDRQMLVLGGGVNLDKDQKNGLTCDTSYPAIGLLDSTTLAWMDHFNSVSEPYAVPQVVYNIIGGRSAYQPPSLDCTENLTLSQCLWWCDNETANGRIQQHGLVAGLLSQCSSLYAPGIRHIQSHVQRRFEPCKHVSINDPYFTTIILARRPCTRRRDRRHRPAWYQCRRRLLLRGTAAPKTPKFEQ